LWGLIDKHPLERLKLLKSDKSIKIRFLSAAEEQRLREAALMREIKIKAERDSANKWRKEHGYDLLPPLNHVAFADHVRPMILLSINTGLRRGEVFSMNMTMTLRYAHLAPEHKANAVEKLVQTNYKHLSIEVDGNS
jgi:hypothetical protein